MSSRILADSSCGRNPGPGVRAGPAGEAAGRALARGKDCRAGARVRGFVLPGPPPVEDSGTSRIRSGGPGSGLPGVLSLRQSAGTTPTTPGTVWGLIPHRKNPGFCVTDVERAGKSGPYRRITVVIGSGPETGLGRERCQCARTAFAGFRPGAPAILRK